MINHSSTTKKIATKFISHCDLPLNSAPFAIELVSCQFELANYQRNLFQQLNIKCPDSVEQSVAKRQAEYLAGRYVAKQALKNLNLTDINIPIGSNGCPIWPINISASITHTNNIAICACADQKKYQYLGIDLEKIVSSQCATDIIDSIANPFEKNLLRKIPINISKALTLLFSAKESLYKALYSSVGHYFDFKEAQLTNVSLENNSFGIILLKNLNPQLKADKQFNGYFAFYDEYVFSIIAQ